MRNPNSTPGGRLYAVPASAPESLAPTAPQQQEALLQGQLHALRWRGLPAAFVLGAVLATAGTVLALKGEGFYNWLTGDEAARQACAVGTIEPGEGPQAGINDAIDNAGFTRDQVAGVMDAANYFSASAPQIPAGAEVTVALDDYDGHQVIAAVRLGEDRSCDFRNNPWSDQIVYLPGK